MRKQIRTFVALLTLATMAACGADEQAAAPVDDATPTEDSAMGKTVVYQVFTRLFGNQVTTNKPWGTVEENGVGKFNDFTDGTSNTFMVGERASNKGAAVWAGVRETGGVADGAGGAGDR